MNPDLPQSPAGGPTTLPQLQQPQQLQAPITSVPAHPATGMSESGSPEAIVEQAKQAVGQYANNPFQLQGVLQQLKAQYISEQYHVSIKAESR